MTEPIDDVDDLEALKLRAIMLGVYSRVTIMLGGKPPRPILDVIQDGPNTELICDISARDWEVIRFSVAAAMTLLAGEEGS